MIFTVIFRWHVERCQRLHKVHMLLAFNMATVDDFDLSTQSHAESRSYSTEFKLKVVKFAEDCYSNRKAAVKFGVDCSRIRKWWQTKSKLESAKAKRKQLEGAKRKPLDEDIEESVLQWVHERRSNGLRVSRKMIANKAKLLHEEKCKETEMSPSFSASSRWLQRFMVRHGLSTRRKTTESQKDIDKLIEKLVTNILQLRRQRAKFSYTDNDIAMDETAVWQDMLPNTTVNTIAENDLQ